MLWLLKGKRGVPGWKDLEQDSKADKIDVVIFDPLAWALVEQDEAPSGYEGLEAGPPDDGLYINPTGVPFYMVDGKRVDSANDVIAALGDEAVKLLEKLGDPDTVLERLGRTY